MNSSLFPILVIFGRICFWTPIGDCLSAKCRISSNLHGVFKKQLNSKHSLPLSFPREPLQYESVYIGPSSIPYWGDCYHYNRVDSKVEGYICYRCFTIIERTVNVLQVVGEEDQQCHHSMDSAQMTCINRNEISAGEGIILYRSTNIHYQYCPIDGRATIEYSLENGHFYCPSRSSKTASEVSNCPVGHRLDMKLRGCTFPDIDMSLQCLGTWPFGDGQQRMFVVFDERAREYRCGVKAELRWPSNSAECQFPGWLHGEYESLSIDDYLLTYHQHQDNGSMVIVNSHCISAIGRTVKVFSRTRCGTTLGYQCLLFNRRSVSVLEFKRNNEIIPHNDPSLCQDTHAVFSGMSWTAVSIETVSDRFESCSHSGQFRSPLPSSRGRCVNMTIDCRHSFTMHLVSYNCINGAIVDSSRYQCLASWREDSRFYTYVLRFNDNTKGCFVSRFDNGYLLMLWSGRQCRRGSHLDTLEAAEESMIVLEPIDNCRNGSNRTGFRTNNINDSVGESILRPSFYISIIYVSIPFVFRYFTATL